MANTPRRRIGPAEPSNPSRAAGAAAPPSAAATAPRAPVQSALNETDPPVPGAPQETGFYRPVPDAPQAQQRVEVKDEFVEAAQPESGEPTDLPGDMHEGGQLEPFAGETLDQAIQRIRQFRKPLGQFSQKLALERRPGYQRYWFNDVPGRIDTALNNGWSHVKGSDGKPVKRNVGTGRDNGQMFAYAMEIPEVFWQEDMAARHAEAAAKLDSLKAAPFRAPKGAATTADRGKFYDPSESEAGPLSIETHTVRG